MTSSPEKRSNEQKRILILSSTYPRWEGDHEPAFVHELASQLTDAFSVHVLAPHAAGSKASETISGVHINRYKYAPSRLETLVSDGGIPANLRRSPWKLLLIPGFLLSMMWSTWRLVRRIKPSAIHAHWIIPQAAVLSFLRPLLSIPPVLVTSHGADLYTFRSPFMQWIKRLAIRRAAAVTVVSEPMEAGVADLAPEGPSIHIAPMGVDLSSRFCPSPDVVRSRNEILFVGRLVRKKGLHHLIDAMPHIRMARPGAFLTVVGFGPELAALQEQTARLDLHDYVNFKGPARKSELPRFYQEAGVFVAPFVQAADGDREGLGLVVVEALGCGCPVVVSDMPQVRQAIGPDISANLVQPGDCDQLAAAIIRVLDQPYDSRAHFNNALLIRERFDWKRVAARYAEILGTIAH